MELCLPACAMHNLLIASEGNPPYQVNIMFPPSLSLSLVLSMDHHVYQGSAAFNEEHVAQAQEGHKRAESRDESDCQSCVEVYAPSQNVDNICVQLLLAFGHDVPPWTCSTRL
ncbi:hypothetical protein KP509_35G000400 [Ceratopteris richardii]|uniref:Uncharacterized protein n=1 Tax=Ceratopteris richardii TaxID=49495 RepID=A0A8T2QCL2_CERRI|nr:hypothetical protein KP509_35G000400 [Ceratopteris richardii]